LDELSVSIVLYKTPRSLYTSAIQSIFDSKLKFKIFVIDNSPYITKDSIFNKKFIRYIWTGKNIGYGSAHNIAIKLIGNKTTFHLILNPDIYFDYKLLPHLIKLLEANKDIGVVMPKILFPNGKNQFLCRKQPTPFDLLKRRFFHFSIKKDTYIVKKINSNKIYEAENLSGCFLLCRTRILRKINGFDTRFFMYLEDYDLVRRINEKYRVIYDPRVHAYHHYSKNSYKKINHLFFHVISAIRYFNKWGWLSRKNTL